MSGPMTTEATTLDWVSRLVPSGLSTGRKPRRHRKIAPHRMRPRLGLARNRRRRNRRRLHERGGIARRLRDAARDGLE